MMYSKTKFNHYLPCYIFLSISFYFTTGVVNSTPIDIINAREIIKLKTQSDDINQPPEQTFKTHPSLSKGIFLIASEQLTQSSFSQTVILITEYSKSGTAGLVINRPLQVAAEKLFPQINNLLTSPGNTYIGGPVAIDSLQLLIQTESELESAIKILDHVYLVNNSVSFKKLMLDRVKNITVKLYAGYAGWSPGQLESEIIRGDWYLWHADARQIFTTPAESVWLELIRLVSAKWVKLSSDL